MPINFEDTLWMRMQRVEQAKQERMQAMGIVAQGAQQVEATNQRAFDQEMEVAPKAAYQAQQLGEPVPQYDNAMLQRASQFGARAYDADELKRQKAVERELATKAFVAKLEAKQKELEWAARKSWNDADNDALKAVETLRQEGLDKRAQAQNLILKLRALSQFAKTQAELQKAGSPGGGQYSEKERIAAGSNVARLVSGAEGFVGKRLGWNDLSHADKMALLNSLRVQGADVRKMFQGVATEDELSRVVPLPPPPPDVIGQPGTGPAIPLVPDTFKPVPPLPGKGKPDKQIGPYFREFTEWFDRRKNYFDNQQWPPGVVRRPAPVRKKGEGPRMFIKRAKAWHDEQTELLRMNQEYMRNLQQPTQQTQQPAGAQEVVQPQGVDGTVTGLKRDIDELMRGLGLTK
jgi:hypothetical protein